MKTTLLLTAIAAIALVAVAVFLLFPSKGPIEESWSASTSQVTELYAIVGSLGFKVKRGVQYDN